MTITIISVGAKPARELDALMQDYLKRLPKHIVVKWHFIRHGSGDPKSSVTHESEAIMRILTADKQKVILLDETGTTLSSPKLAKHLYDTGNDYTFVIGGAYGVSDMLKQRADLVLSFGPMVFPHQLVRLMLTEQLYRTYAIYSGHPYHHE